LASHGEQTGEQDERDLVKAAQDDPARFLELYDRHFHRVYAYAIRRVGNRAAAEDITSEVFHRALANLKMYEWRGKAFVAWLFRIAANEIADHWQAQARNSGVPLADSLQNAEDENDPEMERRAMLFQLVERLPSDQRRVIEMRFGEDKSIHEVGEAIGKSEGAVKQLQRRAIENLRAEMEGSHG
jgi:RNA polymerase sigma-70 factor (ECF subfamily)